MDDRGGWVLEVDIQQFYDMLDRGHLRRFYSIECVMA